jgi:hypothetical protein
MALIKPEQLRLGFYEITGSLFGTSSYANHALTASYAINGGSGGNPFRITTGSITASVDLGSTTFLIKSASTDFLSIDNTGIITLSTQSSELTTPAPNGGIYFTPTSFFVGLD